MNEMKLNAIKTFCNEASWCAGGCLPDELSTVILDYIVCDNSDYARLALLKTLLKWYRELPEDDKQTLAKTVSDFVAAIYEADYADED